MVINIDETAVERQIPRRAGTVIRMHGSQETDHAIHERVTRRETHGHLTLIGAICSDPALQRHLPQLVLPRDASLTRAEKARLEAMAPPLTWVRETHGWVTVPVMKQVLTLYRREVLRHRPGTHVVVAMDAASQHLADDVIAHAARLRVHVLLIPARMTWLLQPLDSHVFAVLKRTFHMLQLEERSANPRGVVDGVAWIDVLERGVRTVLVERDWSRALVSNGLIHGAGSLRERIRRHLEAPLALPDRPPTEGEMTVLVGRARANLSNRLTRGAEAVQARRAALPAPAAIAPEEPEPAPAALPPDHGAIASRTRFRAMRL